MAGPINSKLSEHVVGYLEIVLSQKKIFVDFDIGSVLVGSPVGSPDASTYDARSGKTKHTERWKIERC